MVSAPGAVAGQVSAINVPLEPLGTTRQRIQNPLLGPDTLLLLTAPVVLLLVVAGPTAV
jgi:hypothetical protein